MAKINLYETDAERQRREDYKQIRNEYLDRSNVILSGEVSPNRVISYIATKYGRSIMGVKNILKTSGVYIDAKHPVVLSGTTSPRQASLNF